MIITITGTPGSGKTTIGKLLAQRLGYRFFSTGMLRRQLAKERGMTIEEFNRLGETDPSTDNIADEYQAKLGREEDNMIIDGKVAFHFIPQSVKIFITAAEDVRASRIFNDTNPSRNQQRAKDVEEQKRLNAERVDVDNFRYKRHYGLDWGNVNNYDIVIDTSSHNDPAKYADDILAQLTRLS